MSGTSNKSRKKRKAARAETPSASTANDTSARKTKGRGRTTSSEARPPQEGRGLRIVQADFVAGATEANQFPPPATGEIAFAGRSNVGKSSLLNALLERRGLVRTSSTPGCTRQISWFRAQCDDGAELGLVDLPGYGYARRSKTERNAWAGLIEDYLLQRPTLRGVVVLLDVRRGPEDEELQLLELLSGPARVSRNPLDSIVVVTKLDKLARSARKPALSRIASLIERPIIGFSATEGLGRDELLRRVRRAAGVEVAPSSAAK